MLLPLDPIQLIMVSYFRPTDLRRCLQSLLTNTPEPFRLAIIDNSCGGLETVFTEIPDSRITIYRNDQNLGKGRAVMAWYYTIMANYHNSLFISIDPDLLLPPGWLRKLLTAAYQLPNLGLLAPTIVNDATDTFATQLASNHLVMHRRADCSKFLGPTIYYNRHTAGPLFLICRSFFEKVGGYVQNQLYGNDDGELCRMAAKHRRFIGIATDVVVQHLDADNTPGYSEWKARNVRGNVDGHGYWDKIS